MSLVYTFKALFKTDLQHAFQYPVEVAVRMFDNVFLSLVTLFVWRTIFILNQSPQDKIQMVTIFYLLMPFAATITDAWHGYFVAREIRDGTLNRYLLKPLSFVYYDISNNLSEKIIKICFVIPLMSLGFWYFRPQFGIHASEIVFMTLALIMAGTLTFIIQEIVGYLAFWSDEVTALNDFLAVADITLGGRAVPAFLFPGWLFMISEVLPFRYLTAFPVEIISGSLSNFQILKGFGYQFFWIVLLGVTARWLWIKGIKRYSANGG